MTTMLLCAAAHAQAYPPSETPRPIAFADVGEFATFLALLAALVVVTMVIRNVMRTGRLAL